MEWELGNGIRDLNLDWGLRSGVEIGDWDLGLGLGIGDWD